MALHPKIVYKENLAEYTKYIKYEGYMGMIIMSFPFSTGMYKRFRVTDAKLKEWYGYCKTVEEAKAHIRDIHESNIQQGEVY